MFAFAAECFGGSCHQIRSADEDCLRLKMPTLRTRCTDLISLLSGHLASVVVCVFDTSCKGG